MADGGRWPECDTQNATSSCKRSTSSAWLPFGTGPHVNRGRRRIQFMRPWTKTGLDQSGRWTRVPPQAGNSSLPPWPTSKEVNTRCRAWHRARALFACLTVCLRTLRDNDLSCFLPFSWGGWFFGLRLIAWCMFFAARVLPGCLAIFVCCVVLRGVFHPVEGRQRCC